MEKVPGHGRSMRPTDSYTHCPLPSLLRSPATSLTGLESPIRPSSPEECSSSTNSASTNPSDAGTESPGSTTLSKVSLDSHHGSLSRMSRPFFGLSGFLRSRYPSSTQRPSVKAVPEALEGGTESEGGLAEEQGAPSAEDNNSDDEDRRTLRGVPVNGELEEDTKDGARLQVDSREKKAGTSIKMPVPGEEDGGALAISHILTHI
jgi:UV radiation resistance-associated gene protein